MKNKLIIIKFLIFVFVGYINTASAATFSFDSFYPGSGSGLTLRDSNNSVVLNSPIENGLFSYDSALNTSSGSINTPDAFTSPAIYLHDMAIFETSYGSLFISAQMDALGFTNVGIISEVIIDYNYDAFNDVTIFTLSTLDTDNDGILGVAITNPDLAGLSLEINGVMSALAYVENPFPTYIPVPAAAWLFASGLIGLAGFARRKT